MYARLILGWIGVTAPLVLWLAPMWLGFSPQRRQSDRFLVDEDIWLYAGVTAALFSLVFAHRFLGAAARRFRRPIPPILFVTVLALAVVAIGGLGSWMVFSGYGLSRDEDLARFGAQMLADGQLWSPVAAPWRPFVAALAPEFVRFSSGGAFWQPAYLPVNAALQALGGLAGAAALVNPLLAAVAVIAAFAVGRRLWPDRSDLALVAAVLVASSSQVLTTAMTAYAMTAHLAFNLVWLWLHLRGGRGGHLGALIMGFLACGLHQLIFHPLFVAPFILQLWLGRRWALAGLYTAAYAGMGVFWLEFPTLSLAWCGGAAATAGGVAGLPGQVVALVGGARPPTVRSMAENLLRFAVWQNLLLVPLAAAGVAPAWRAGGAWRALCGGIAVTTVAMAVLMPYQGHGWGYRYWHGLIGSFALIAAFAWGRLTDGLAPQPRQAAGAVFAIASAASLTVLFPIEAAMAHAFVRPYARAYRAIRAAPVGVVIVDPGSGWYIDDLVRNSPDLANRPLVLRGPGLTPTAAATLCQKYSVAELDGPDARRFGIRASAVPGPDDLWAQARCGLGRAKAMQLAPAAGSP
ncbi:MAG TPA: hypothetical protein VIC25_04655 [Caulobacteraceae bacterium]